MCSSLQNLLADQFEVIEVFLKQLKILLEIVKAHVHQVFQVRSVFLIVFSLIQGGQISNFLHVIWIDLRSFEIWLVINFLVNDVIYQCTALMIRWLARVIIKFIKKSFAFLLEAFVIFTWLLGVKLFKLNWIRWLTHWDHFILMFLLICLNLGRLDIWLNNLDWYILRTSVEFIDQWLCNLRLRFNNSRVKPNLLTKLNSIIGR